MDSKRTYQSMDSCNSAHDQSEVEMSDELSEGSLIHLGSFRLEQEESSVMREKSWLPVHRRVWEALVLPCVGYETKGYHKDHGTSSLRRLSTYAGVVAPIALGQFGNLLFLRAGQYANKYLLFSLSFSFFFFLCLCV